MSNRTEAETFWLRVQGIALGAQKLCPQLCLMVLRPIKPKSCCSVSTLELQQRKATVTFILLAHREGSSGQRVSPSLACSIYLLARRKVFGWAADLHKQSPPGLWVSMWLSPGTEGRGPTWRIGLGSQWVPMNTAMCFNSSFFS